MILRAHGLTVLHVANENRIDFCNALLINCASAGMRGAIKVPVAVDGDGNGDEEAS